METGILKLSKSSRGRHWNTTTWRANGNNRTCGTVNEGQVEELRQPYLGDNKSGQILKDLLRIVTVSQTDFPIECHHQELYVHTGMCLPLIQ